MHKHACNTPNTGKQITLDATGRTAAKCNPLVCYPSHAAQHDVMISHDQLSAIATALRVTTCAAQLERGVYTTYYLGALYGFIVTSSGQAMYGVHVPDGVPECRVLAGLYRRLVTDDAVQLQLMA